MLLAVGHNEPITKSLNELNSMAKKKESPQIEAPEIENPVEETQVAELDEREKDLSEREEKLAEREKAVSQREAENEEYANVLKEKEKALNEREKAFDEKSSEDLATKTKKETEENSDVFEFEGGKYRFIPDAPKTLKVLGVVRSQEQIIKDEEALLHLIGGKCALIEKID